MGLKNYRYNVTEAGLLYGIETHPQLQIKNLGFHIVKAEPCTVAESWFFRTDSLVQNIPNYIHELQDDFKFSDE